MKRRFALICALLLAVFGCEPERVACEECQVCPTVEVVEVEVIETPATTIVPTTDPTFEVEFDLDPKVLVGEWVSDDGKPFPLVEIVAQREGSKTPLNISIRQDREPFHIGCGFYQVGTEAWCMRTNKPNDTPERIETTISFVARHPGKMDVVLPDIGSFGTFMRKPTVQ